ncbi:MAG: DUF4385 domain-containing protein [Candidatus Sericytochromatia bacterium]
MAFDYSLDYDQLDLRAHPELYRVGIGEQGVLTVEPYKSELVPLWRFKTPDIATESSQALYAMYLRYKAQGDFVGMDMARKFIQMGYTRARRYANHPGGRKYDPTTGDVLPSGNDPVKAESARIFKGVWDRIRADEAYQAAKAKHIARYGK